ADSRVASHLVPRGAACHLRGGLFVAGYLRRDTAVHAHGAALRADVGGSSADRAGVSVRSDAARTSGACRSADWRADLSISGRASRSGAFLSPAIHVAGDEPDLCW